MDPEELHGGVESSTAVVWKSHAVPGMSRDEESMTRRRFVKSSGGATAAAVLAWHGLQKVARAEVPGGSGPLP